ncbi:MAG: polyketide cyclase [Pedobacter sp.]|nr:MAG: polyketide cyclase [Pedobacter sp.]
MEQQNKTIITVGTIVSAPLTTVWEAWTKPEHIMKWTFASDDWHAPHAENELKVAGKFSTTMAAKDGSVSFEFYGTYTDVQPEKFIAYTMGDGRRAEITFNEIGDQTEIVESFEAEETNPIKMQHDGWQSIVDNFKKHTESLT